MNKPNRTLSKQEPSVFSVREKKKALRKEVMRQIASLDEAYRKDADARIISLLASLPAYRAAHTVFCFVGSRTEINTMPFLEKVLKDGKTLAVPLCLSKGIMEARRIESPDELSPGYYGLLEPERSAPVIMPQELDLAVIPCVSCSHEGIRLGHGGGFYDIYFSRHPEIPSAMICYDRITCEDIPYEAHDLIFPLVVTEKGIFRNPGVQAKSAR